MKSRRDITLGEMQDECIRRSNDGKTCAGCDYSFVCPVALGKEMCPKLWFLIDPPRFNEQQMAALKQSYDSGVTKIKKTENAIHYTIPDLGVEIVIINHSITSSMEVGETLDIAELLGKDAT